MKQSKKESREKYQKFLETKKSKKTTAPKKKSEEREEKYIWDDKRNGYFLVDENGKVTDTELEDFDF